MLTPILFCFGVIGEASNMKMGEFFFTELAPFVGMTLPGVSLKLILTR